MQRLQRDFTWMIQQGLSLMRLTLKQGTTFNSMAPLRGPNSRREGSQEFRCFELAKYKVSAVGRPP